MRLWGLKVDPFKCHWPSEWSLVIEPWGWVQIILWLPDAAWAGVFFHPLYATLKLPPECANTPWQRHWGTTHMLHHLLSQLKIHFQISPWLPISGAASKHPKIQIKAPRAVSRPPLGHTMSLNEPPIRREWALGCAVTLGSFEMHWMLTSYSSVCCFRGHAVCRQQGATTERKCMKVAQKATQHTRLRAWV